MGAVCQPVGARRSSLVQQASHCGAPEATTHTLVSALMCVFDSPVCGDASGVLCLQQTLEDRRCFLAAVAQDLRLSVRGCSEAEERNMRRQEAWKHLSSTHTAHRLPGVCGSNTLAATPSQGSKACTLNIQTSRSVPTEHAACHPTVPGDPVSLSQRDVSHTAHTHHLKLATWPAVTSCSSTKDTYHFFPNRTC